MGELRSRLRVDVSRRTTSLVVAALALSLAGCAEPLSTSDSPAAPGTPAASTEPATPTPEPSLTSTPTPTLAPTPSASPTVEPASEPARGTTLAVLAALVVKGRAAKTGFDRAQFGPAWLDADRNGCDTRNDILRRDLVEIVVKPNTNGCVVLSGTRADDYTGQAIAHLRGNSQVDIDHRVSLSNAWQTGAQQWSLAKRAAFANDPLNLSATAASANSSKSDGDAATWLPPNKAYRCDFVAAQVAVKTKYGLWATRAEKDAIARILASCPGHQLPADPTDAATEVDHDLKPVPASKPKPKPKPRAKPKPKTFAEVPREVHYENCTAAREAGGAPVRTGEPGYGRHLDRDGDGVGCE
ncbi:hypothetical protein BJ980_001753 [Nocardioides daedukensis]|uniref:Excalibur calcium-binding domain-containing protein n=1 Tax=Nocardioides daedukensis TaxID=634462 RepID=A0A7Y9UVT2_9ACTN|nr:DUF1524 domain-containing protein [Nocardioides daedukensis]NYG58830.1 hypothetical protein [Nocardioides daedukensis]